MFFEQNYIDEYSAKFSSGFIYSYKTLLQKYTNENLIFNGLKICCGINIGDEYLETSFKKLKESINKDDGIYDLACVFDKSFDQLPKNTLIRNMVAFIIVEKGECKLLPNTFSINLICARLPGKGGLLFGLYIYTLINNDAVTNKQGILELANAYFNIGGLCLYTKFGFQIDETLYGANCFGDYNNLPMLLNIDDYGSTKDEQNDRLSDIMLHGRNAFAKNILCNIRDREIQQLAGLLHNFKTFIKYLDGNPDISYYIIPDRECPEGIINFTKLNDYLNLDIVKTDLINDKCLYI